MHLEQCDAVCRQHLLINGDSFTRSLTGVQGLVRGPKCTWSTFMAMHLSNSDVQESPYSHCTSFDQQAVCRQRQNDLDAYLNTSCMLYGPLHLRIVGSADTFMFG